MDTKKPALPTKFLVVTHVLSDGATARLTFQPVGDDNASIALPPKTSAMAFQTNNPALLLSPDKTDSAGLTVLVHPHVPCDPAKGVVVTGQVTLPDGLGVIKGESEPLEIWYGPTGPDGYKLLTPKVDEPKPDEEKQ